MKNAKQNHAGYIAEIILIAEGCTDASEQEVLEAWQILVDTGTAWRLQGWFGRTAEALIDAGLISDGRENLETTTEDRAAAKVLLAWWMGLKTEGADVRRLDDLAELVAMHRAGLIFQNNGDYTETAYTSKGWPSGNHGTPARILAIYNDPDLTDPSEIREMISLALHADSIKA